MLGKHVHDTQLRNQAFESGLPSLKSVTKHTLQIPTKIQAKLKETDRPTPIHRDFGFERELQPSYCSHQNCHHMIQTAALARFVMSNINFSITAEKLPPKVSCARYLTRVKKFTATAVASETQPAQTVLLARQSWVKKTTTCSRLVKLSRSVNFYIKEILAALSCSKSFANELLNGTE